MTTLKVCFWLCLFIVRLFRKGGMLKTGFQAFLFVLIPEFLFI